MNKIDIFFRSSDYNNNQLRKMGYIPIVLMEKGKSFSFQIKSKDFKINNGINFFEINNDSYLVKEVQKDYLTQKILHVSFLKVNKDELIEVEVPLIFEKRDFGMFEPHIHHNFLTVKALSKNIPEKVLIELNELSVDNPVMIKDINLVNCKIKEDLDRVLVSLHHKKFDKDGEEDKSQIETN